MLFLHAARVNLNSKNTLHQRIIVILLLVIYVEVASLTREGGALTKSVSILLGNLIYNNASCFTNGLNIFYNNNINKN